MVSRLILGTTISLALVLCPFLVDDTHAKSSRKKSSHSAVKASRSSHNVERSKPRIVSRSYSRRSYASRSYQRYRSSDDYEPSYSSRTAVRTAAAKLQLLHPPVLPGGSG